MRKTYVYLVTLCGTSFTSLLGPKKKREWATWEWHSNRKDTPTVPPQRNRKNRKQLKLSGDIPELVSKRTTNNSK